MATIIAAVAAVGTQAYGASQGKKGGGKLPGDSTKFPTWDRVFNRGTTDMADEERRVMEDALAQANFLQPEQYKLLGFEPIYDTRQNSDIGVLGNQADALQGDSDKQRQRAQAIGEETFAAKQKRKEDIAALGPKPKGPGLKADRKAWREAKANIIGQTVNQVTALATEKRQIEHQMPRTQKELAVAQRQLGDAQTLPKRIVGFKKLEEPGDPTQSKGDLYRMALDLENQTLVRALKGEAPLDATMKTAFEERERNLRERLRRQLGPDYDTSTAGSTALANFDREKAEAFQAYNTDTVQKFSSMTQARAHSLSELTTSRMAQLMAPSYGQAQRALNLGQVISDRNTARSGMMGVRTLQLQGEEAAFRSQAYNTAAKSQAIQGVGEAAGKFGEGLSSSGLSKYLSKPSEPSFNSSDTQFIDKNQPGYAG